MDPAQAHALQRSRPPYPRASSRSSNSTTHTRMTSQSANSSSTQITTSPQLSNSHPAHRFYHTSCNNAPGSPRTAARHTPQLSREASAESTRQQAISAFLQEKLQRERRAESEKMGHIPTLSRINTDMSASLDLGRATQDSPLRSGDSDSQRPRSSAGAEPPKRPGLGLKEMEQVISTLHKQNFDLKLELYHRREKQAGLEKRIDGLESDKRQVEEINDTLLEELEKRDKAVEEAVAMIVVLEAKVEQLLSERSMVHQVEREGFFCPQDFEAKYRNPTPESSRPDITKFEDDVKVINRMPSFLSERSENTENLRNVYLGVRGSVLSLQRVVEGTPEPETIPANGLASPTLSVLSESSFASVYGKKGQDNGFPPPIDKPLSLDGVDTHHHMAQTDDFHGMSKGRPPVLPVRAATANCFLRGNHTSGPFQSISGIMGHGSPLQQMEQLDRSHMALKEGFRPTDQGKERRGSQPTPVNTSPRKLTREEKREALRKVLTDAPGGVRLHDQAFPPTPDTISTSTLHRMRDSNDSLAHQHQHDGKNHRFSAIYHDSDVANGRHPDQHSGASLKEKPRPVDHGMMRDPRSSQVYGQQGPTTQRPRSASETTVSQKRDNGWNSDSDDESDSRSLQSSLDIWMRESAKPARDGGRASPDLFAFPNSTSKGGWAPETMFGPNSVRPGTQGIGPDANYMNDLFSLRQALYAANAGTLTVGPPPPPDRRSSLHARTASTSGSVIQNSPKPKGEAWQNSPGQRARQGHIRRQSDGVRMEMRTPVQQQQFNPPPQPHSDQKKNHYPPIVGQQGPRSGLNRLFRRSIGACSSSNTPEGTPQSATEPTADASKNIQNMGAPIWAGKNAVVDDDDRTGATPPPIMLNPRQMMRRNTAGAEAMPDLIPPSASAPEQLSEMPAGGRQTPTMQKPAQAAPAPSGTGIRRKWLPGFGRASSGLKNRAG